MIEFCLFSERLIQDTAHVKHWLRDLIGFSNGRRTVDVVFQVGAVLYLFWGFYAVFNKISVISRQQLLIHDTWVNKPVLGL